MRRDQWNLNTANTRRCANVGLKLGQRYSRCPKINPAFTQPSVLVGCFFLGHTTLFLKCTAILPLQLIQANQSCYCAFCSRINKSPLQIIESYCFEIAINELNFKKEKEYIYIILKLVTRLNINKIN